MKIQIFIISILIINVFALPVPDEEVSPAQSVSGPKLKSDSISKPEIKPVEGDESRLVDEGSKSQAAINIADSIEQKKIEISKSAPDAELPQSVLNKETTKNNQLTNNENKLEDVKILVAAIEEQKQVVDEPKLEIINLENKAGSTISADSAITKEKIKEPNVVEAQIFKSKLPSFSSDLTKPVISLHSEENKKDLPARQERGNEESAKEMKPTADHIRHIGQPTHSTNVKEEIESLQLENTSVIAKEQLKSIESQKTITEKSKNNLPEIKPSTAESVIKKNEKSHVVPVGDISLQSSEENNIKSLKNKKLTQSGTETKPDAIESGNMLKTPETEVKLTDQALTESLSQAKPLEQLVEKIDSNKNLQESKESESSESKESGESKEKKNKLKQTL